MIAHAGHLRQVKAPGEARGLSLFELGWLG